MREMSYHQEVLLPKAMRGRVTPEFRQFPLRSRILRGPRSLRLPALPHFRLVVMRPEPLSTRACLSSDSAPQRSRPPTTSVPNWRADGGTMACLAA